MDTVFSVVQTETVQQEVQDDQEDDGDQEDDDDQEDDGDGLSYRVRVRNRKFQIAF